MHGQNTWRKGFVQHAHGRLGYNSSGLKHEGNVTRCCPFLDLAEWYNVQQ